MRALTSNLAPTDSGALAGRPAGQRLACSSLIQFSSRVAWMFEVILAASRKSANRTFGRIGAQNKRHSSQFTAGLAWLKWRTSSAHFRSANGDDRAFSWMLHKVWPIDSYAFKSNSQKCRSHTLFAPAAVCL